MTSEERVAKALKALPDELKAAFCNETDLGACDVDFLDTAEARERARDWVEAELNAEREPETEVLDLRRELRQWRAALSEAGESN